MTTIMMPTSIDASIRDMCSDAISQAVSVLAGKYGFDPEEAKRHLADNEVKIVRKRGPTPKSEPKVKLAAKAKSEDKPKRAKTGYLIYADYVRDDVRGQMEATMTAGEKLKPQDVVRAIARQWKDLDEDKQKAWSLAAKEGELLPQFLVDVRDSALKIVGETLVENDEGDQEMLEAGKAMIKAGTKMHESMDKAEELSDLEDDSDDDDDDDDDDDE
tara:strand:- start:21 stop:668 length:648 start_codon:yes stop_codon:yes gene_type:complete